MPVGRVSKSYRSCYKTDTPAIADIDDPIAPEQLLVGKTPTSQSQGPSPEAIAVVSDMGFSSNQARKALHETGGNIEAAVEWLFANPDDPGVDSADLAVAEAVSTKGTSSQNRGSAALPAMYRLKAFISHKGNSIHVGHYVAHIYEPGLGWVLFNDEKVRIFSAISHRNRICLGLLR